MSKKAKKISKNKSLVRLFLGICLVLFTIATILSFTSTSFAADDEATVMEKAREKKYVGGADEGDLKVLPSVPNSKVKKTKTEEADEGF